MNDGFLIISFFHIKFKFFFKSLSSFITPDFFETRSLHTFLILEFRENVFWFEVIYRGQVSVDTHTFQKCWLILSPSHPFLSSDIWSSRAWRKISFPKVYTLRIFLYKAELVLGNFWWIFLQWSEDEGTILCLHEWKISQHTKSFHVKDLSIDDV